MPGVEKSRVLEVTTLTLAAANSAPDYAMKHEPTQADFRPEPALWSVQQAAIYLGVSTRTIHNLMARGELVRRKIGSRTLIPKTSLQSFLKRDHETQSK
jgi:excisionase family DNA binding protein